MVNYHHYIIVDQRHLLMVNNIVVDLILYNLVDVVVFDQNIVHLVVDMDIHHYVVVVVVLDMDIHYHVVVDLILVEMVDMIVHHHHMDNQHVDRLN